MRPAITFCFAGLFAMVVTVSASAQNLKGDWLLKECTINGKKQSGKNIEGMQLKLGYTDFTATAGDRKSSGSVKITRGNRKEKTPDMVTMTIESGEDSGRVLKGIFKRKGRDLTVVFSPSQDFPTEFESTEANQYALMTYSYVKKSSFVTDAQRRARRDPSVITGMGGAGGPSGKKK